jgi:hypothetical protein
MHTQLTAPPASAGIPPSAIHSGDFIQVRLPGATVITAYVTEVQHGPGHEPGGAGVDWTSAWMPAGPLVALRGHAEYTATDVVVRLAQGPVPGRAA